MGSSSGWSIFIVASLSHNKIDYSTVITAVNREERNILIILKYIHVNDNSIKCKISMWIEPPCLIMDNEAMAIVGLTIPVEITVDIDVAIVKTI